MKLNAYADARRASFGFVKEIAGDGRTRSGPGWHCTPAGLIVSGGERSCGKATCRFCWARAVGTLLNGVHARREACAAAGVPFEVRLWRDDFPLSRDEYSVRFNTFCAERSELKKAVDSRKAGTPAGGWRGILLLPHPADLSPRPPSRVGGLPSDGVLTEFSVAVYEGPAVRRLGSGRPGSREMAIPGEFLDGCLDGEREAGRVLRPAARSGRPAGGRVGSRPRLPRQPEASHRVRHAAEEAVGRKH